MTANIQVMPHTTDALSWADEVDLEEERLEEERKFHTMLPSSPLEGKEEAEHAEIETLRQEIAQLQKVLEKERETNLALLNKQKELQNERFQGQKLIAGLHRTIKELRRETVPIDSCEEPKTKQGSDLQKLQWDLLQTRMRLEGILEAEKTTNLRFFQKQGMLRASIKKLQNERRQDQALIQKLYATIQQLKKKAEESRETASEDSLDTLRANIKRLQDERCQDQSLMQGLYAIIQQLRKTASVDSQDTLVSTMESLISKNQELERNEQKYRREIDHLNTKVCSFTRETIPEMHRKMHNLYMALNARQREIETLKRQIDTQQN